MPFEDQKSGRPLAIDLTRNPMDYIMHLVIDFDKTFLSVVVLLVWQ